MKNLKQVLQKRVELLSETLDLNKNRIRDWAITQTVLSVIWNLQEGNERCKPWIKIAEVLSTLD